MTISRRKFLSLGAGAFVVLTLPISVFRRRRVVRRSVPVMGTIAELVVVDPDESKAREALDAAIGELRWVHRTMSRFIADSDIGRANLEAGRGPVVITDGSAAVLEEALRWAELSDGRFDPCLGRASDLWNVGNRRRPPDSTETGRLAGERLYRALELDRWRSQPVVRLTSDEASIDLGGIAKGYGVDRAVLALRRRGIDRALVNAGGDLYALGSSEDGDPWKIGIRSADRPDKLDVQIDVSDRGVATSGDYFQFFDHAGRRYHHLLDPLTAEPRRSDRHSLTVGADTCMRADAAATTLFGYDSATGEALLAVGAPEAEILHLG